MRDLHRRGLLKTDPFLTGFYNFIFLFSYFPTCHCGKTKMPIFQIDKLNQKQKLWTLNQKQKLFHFTSHKRAFFSPHHLRCPRPELQSPKAWFKLPHLRNIFPDCHGTRQDTRRSTQLITVETSTIASSRVKHRVFGVKCAPSGS